MNDTNTTTYTYVEDKSNSLTSFESTLAIIGYMNSMISVISAGLIFILKSKSPDKWTYDFTTKIAISSFVNAAGFFMGVPSNQYKPSDFNLVCSLQGFLIGFGGLSSVLWIFVTTAMLYTKMFCVQWWINKNATPKNFPFKKLSWGIFGLSFCLAIFPAISGEYVFVKGIPWCWIDGS